MKLIFIIFALFGVCMVTQCLLGVGDNLISALSSNLKDAWDISPFELAAIYSVPYAIGLLACIATGWTIPCVHLRYIMAAGGALLFLGLLGMFGALAIPILPLQIGAFTLARIIFQCGFFPMCICIDYLMSMCYNYYNDAKAQQDAEKRKWYTFTLSFGMIGAMQTYSDYGGKTIADLLLPLLSLDSLRLAMSSTVAVAILIVLCIVAIHYFAESFHASTNNAHRAAPRMDAAGAVDWADYVRRHYIAFGWSIAVLTALNAVWVGSWNAFLMSMPQIWQSSFGLTTYAAPVHVGYGIAASCVFGGVFCLLPPSRTTLRVFAGLFAALAVPTFVGMLLPEIFPYPLTLSIAVCCLGALMNIVIMMLIPFLFRNFDFAMVFVWLEFSRTIATVSMPIVFGVVLSADHGAALCIILFGTLVVGGFLLYLLLMRMAIHNEHTVAAATNPAIEMPLGALDDYESASELSDAPTTPRFVHI